MTDGQPFQTRLNPPHFSKAVTNNKEKIHSNINQLVDYFKNYRVLYKTEKENLHIKSCSLNLGINNKISHLLLLKDGRIAFCLDNNKTFYIFQNVT